MRSGDTHKYIEFLFLSPSPSLSLSLSLFRSNSLSLILSLTQSLLDGSVYQQGCTLRNMKCHQTCCQVMIQCGLGFLAALLRSCYRDFGKGPLGMCFPPWQPLKLKKTQCHENVRLKKKRGEKTSEKSSGIIQTYPNGSSGHSRLALTRSSYRFMACRPQLFMITSLLNEFMSKWTQRWSSHKPWHMSVFFSFSTIAKSCSCVDISSMNLQITSQ